MIITKFEEKHLTEAADLFINIYKQQRSKTPLLPVTYEDKESIMPLLKKMIDYNQAAYAAEENGQLIGYMLGYLPNQLKGSQKGVFIPEWAHAAVFVNRLKIYQELFNNLSREYVNKKHYNYAIHVLPFDQEEVEFWFWNGFGMLGADAVRPIKEVKHHCDNNIKVKIATLDDVDKLLELVRAHQMHYPSAPIFLPIFELDSRKEFEDAVINPETNVWIAYNDEEMIGYMSAYQSSVNADILNDKETLSVKGAFVLPKYRGRDIGSLLLSKIVESDMVNNYQRLSVDFESANTVGKKFWLRHFEQVNYALIRHVDDRMENSIIK